MVRKRNKCKSVVLTIAKFSNKEADTYFKIGEYTLGTGS